ncbi:hypothetical protein JHK82_037233 [Glycine max]|nr:hypothetical protein JHK82_037233 [Glycine max]
MKITFRSGIWDGTRLNSDDWIFNEITAFRPIISVTSTEALYWDEPGDRLSRFVMKDDGMLQRYIWDNKVLKWIEMYEARKDFCDDYGACGVNGICNIKDVPVYCDCLKGFKPKSQEEWNSFNRSGGCIRRTPLNCTQGDRFQKLSAIKLPKLLQFWTNNSMNLEECKVECLKNCSCTAYANSAMNEGPHGCFLWFGDLIDIRKLINEEAGQLDLYVKLWKEGRAVEFMDANLDLATIRSELLRCLQVGLLCVQKLPKDRPTMSSVVFMLSNESITLAQPKKPEFIEEGLEFPGYSNNSMTITLLEARN